MASEPDDYEETPSIGTESDVNVTDMNQPQSTDTNEDDTNLQIMQPKQIIKHTTSRDQLISASNLYNESPRQHNATTAASESQSPVDQTNNDLIDLTVHVPLPNQPKNLKTKTSSSSSKRTKTKKTSHKHQQNDAYALNIGDIGTDTESDDELGGPLNADLPLTNVPTKYDDNEFKHLPYEEELIERLSIALTYLLHDESPLWTNDDRDADEYAEDLMNMLVAPKHNKNKNKNDKPVHERSEIKEKKSFQQKCTEYTVGGGLVSQLRDTKKKLDALYRPTYHARWKSLHHFWTEWTEHADILSQKYSDKKTGINDDIGVNEEDENDYEFEDLTVDEELHLEDDTDDFLLKFNATMDELMVQSSGSAVRNSLAGGAKTDNAFDKFVKKTTDRTLRDFKMEDPTKKYKSRAGKAHISASLEQSKGSTNKLSTTPLPFGHKAKKSRSYTPTPDHDIDEKQNRTSNSKQVQLVQLHNNSSTNNKTKEEELRVIKHRNQMKKWIQTYKHKNIKWGHHHSLDTPHGHGTHVDVFDQKRGQRSCAAVCQQWVSNIGAIFKKEEFVKEIPLNLPMYAWTWQNLVSYIESEEQYKKFSSYFWEYRINGPEICNMKSKQIELLLECSFLNNSKVFEQKFDENKLRSQSSAFYGDADEEKWESAVLADELYEYIVKGRVQSQIVSRYYTAWDIVTHVAMNRKHSKHRMAKYIVDIVSLLRAEPSQGPKKFWKMNAVFFNKIDNYLMALIGRGSVRRIFQKYCPDFLYEAPIDIPTEPNFDKKASVTDPSTTRKKSASVARQGSHEVKQSHMYLGSPVVLNAAMSPGMKRVSKYGVGGMGLPPTSILNMNKNQFTSMLNTITPTHSHLNPAPVATESSSMLSIPGSTPLQNSPNMSFDSPSKAMRQLMDDRATKTSLSPRSRTAVSTVSLHSHDGGGKDDMLDKCVDCCCCCKRCLFRTWVHNLDRIYIAMILVVTLSLVSGCAFATLWYFYGSTAQTQQAMELAVQSVGERARHTLSFEFWIPQMFTGYLINGLQTGAYAIDAAQDVTGGFDAFFASFVDINHTSSMYGISMYNVADDSMLGAYYTHNDNRTHIQTVVEQCERNYNFSAALGRRAGTYSNSTACDRVYNPKEELWFVQAQSLEFGQSAWSEPKSSFEGDVHMTLITRYNYSGAEVILLAEMNSLTLDDIVRVDNLPVGTVLFVVTPTKKVISATNGEFMVTNIANTTLVDGDMSCTLSAQTCDTLEQLGRDEVAILVQSNVDIDKYVYQGSTGDLTIFGFSFYMFYMDFFGQQINLANEQSVGNEVGFVVISYDESYLDNIYISFYASWTLLLVMKIISCSIICCNIKTDQRRRKLVRYATSGSIGAVSIGAVRGIPKPANYNTTQTKIRTPPDVNDMILEEEESAKYSTSTEEKENDSKQKPTATEKAVIVAVALGNKSVTVDTVTNAVLDGIYNDVIEEKEIKINVDDLSDNVLKLHSKAPPLTPSDPELYDKQDNYNKSADSNTPLKADGDGGRTGNMPESAPHTAKKMVSFDAAEFTPGSTSFSPIPLDDEDKSCTNKICNCSPIQLIVICIFLIGFTFLAVVAIWVKGTSLTSQNLIDSLMVKQEHFAVSDEVYKIFHSSDMLYGVLSKALKSGQINFDFTGMTTAERQAAIHDVDYLFTRLFKTFSEPNEKYRQYYIYAGTPAGYMQGARWRDGADSVDLVIGSRLLTANMHPDPSNASNYIQDALIPWVLGSYVAFAVDPATGFRSDGQEEISENTLYDPRCRTWYVNAIKHGFVGTISQAFPAGFKSFYEDENTAALQTTQCTAARASYVEMFGLANYTNDEYVNLTSAESRAFILNGNKTKEELYVITWDRYVFASLLQQGLTASAVVSDDVTGELLAVVSIDYTLNDLSIVLAEGVGNESSWFAWIFETHSAEPYMIASSDKQVLVEADSISGCIQLAETNEQIPVLATEHNNTMIKIMSKEIVKVYGIEYIHNLSIDASEPQSLNIPIDLPKLEVGRIHYYTDLNKQINSIDWIIAKTIDTVEIESGESNDMTISVLCLMMLMTVILITFREFKAGTRDKDDGDIDQSEYDSEDLEEMQVNKDDPLGYWRKMTKMKHIVEGSANILWKLACDDFDGIITTNSAKDFMAQRANQHVSANENNNFMFLMCALEFKNKWTRLQFLQFMDSNWYSVPMQFIIMLHLVMTVFEPSTPFELQRDGTADIIIFIISICIVCELIDVFLIGCQRYMEFTLNPAILKQLYQLNYGIKHKYCRQLKRFKDHHSNNTGYINKLDIVKLIFFGPNSMRYLCHFIVYVLIVINFLFQVFLRKSPFAYYLPIMPILIIIKNEYILSFLSEFFFAINFARDVLFSYLCFIMVFAIFGVSLFGKTVNQNASADSFRSIKEAFITSFVYISTSENYDDIVYATIASEYYQNANWIILANVICICIIFVIFGLFVFIPMIIHKFEEAFSEKKIHRESEHNNEKMNAIIAAFIMLDMNGDMGIDMDEFQHLITHSILVNKNKMMADAFNYFDDDGSQELDLYEFTTHLLTQQFRDKLFVTKTQMQNKGQAWLECNVFRRYRIHIIILILFVMPVATISLLQNLKNIESRLFDIILLLCFLLNFVEIHLRWFAFGQRRFFDLKRYPNPPYVVAAISKYIYSTTKNYAHTDVVSADDLIIRLSSAQRNWAVHHLRDTRPLSNLDKSTLSIIHRIEFTVIWFTFLFYLIMTSLFEPDTLGHRPGTQTQGYQRYFLQFGILIRIFTLLRSNQKIIYIVFTVFSAFASLFAFLFLLIYTFARWGCTLFEPESHYDIVIDDIYPAASSIIASFTTTGDGMLTLLQLMIGEGWHEVMYLHVLSTNLVYSVYFLFYILIVTIIISNLFVGLFLSNVDELKKQSTDDELKKKFNKSKNFKHYALNKLDTLQFQLNKIQLREKKMKKEIGTIRALLIAQKLNDDEQRRLAGANQINKVAPHTQFNLMAEQ